ncbi:MAG: polysaccharide biosynthesis protein [Bacteroidales bacterium]|nr:polysaccharide biosynthesis protein [Bacteroidales bacterium]MBR3287607.1 polysaccharide biosynthesis protein [Bacteroidales bacterium]
MIPKVIHYCWLSRNPIPADIRECMKSWKRHMPDWEFKLWNTENFDVQSVPFVRDALSVRKWAFACDYIRCHALYHEGGVYLDSDVFVRKPLDFVLDNRAFSAVECHPAFFAEGGDHRYVREDGTKTAPDLLIHDMQIQAAIMGAEKGHPFFGECLAYYQTHPFVNIEHGPLTPDNISPIVLARIAEKYGFRYYDREQQLAEGFHLYPSSLFCPYPPYMKEEAVAVHCCFGSWRHSQVFSHQMPRNLKARFFNLMYRLGLYKSRKLQGLK